MAPQAQRDQSDILLASKPIFGTHKLTAVLRVLEIIVSVIYFRRTVGVMTRGRGMEGDAVLD